MPEIKRFRGLKNTESEERLRAGDLSEATNVDLTNSGKLMSRKGYEQVNATAVHSLYSNHLLAVVGAGSTLSRVNPDGTLTALASLGSSNPVSYETVGDTIYYANGAVVGSVVGATARSWGVAPPAGQPAAQAQSTGVLTPGTYQYAMTYVCSDGHESGTGVAGQVTLTAQGGIQFSGMVDSTNPRVNGKMLYLSGPDGEVLYRVATVPSGISTFYVGVALGTVPLTTQFAGPPPAGGIVRYFAGRMWVVVGEVAYFSDPYDLELFRIGTNYLRAPAALSLFEPIGDGIFAATQDGASGDDSEAAGTTWYWAGTNPMQMKSVHVFDHGAVPGTSVLTNAGFLQQAGADAEGISPRLAVVWVSRFGICVGFEGGAAENLTEGRYSFPVAQRGAGMVRQDRGYISYVATLQGVSAANNEYNRG